MATSALTRLHQRRLREIHRSAGWPCHDNLELDLLSGGWIERQTDAAGRETLRLTDTGIAALAQARVRNRQAYDAHEALVERVCLEMQRAGRLVWCGLSLRARVPRDGGEAWAIVRPDAYSIRHTSVEAYLCPIVHEIKVRRADLLGDLRREPKRAGYQWLSSETWYVLAAGIAEPEEVPPECGVMLAHGLAPGEAMHGIRLEPVRAALHRPLQEPGRLPFGVWMALARATPRPAPEPTQGWLGDPGGDAPVDGTGHGGDPAFTIGDPSPVNDPP